MYVTTQYYCTLVSDIQPAGQNGIGQVLLDFITPMGGVECGISCCSMWKVVTEIAEA